MAQILASRGVPDRSTATTNCFNDTINCPNKIVITVPVQGGFGANRPIFGNTLFNVTALSGGRNNDTLDVYADVDATRSFDFVLGGGGGGGGGGGACMVTGGGAIAGTGASDGQFTLNPQADSLKGKVAYRDDGAGVDFRSTRITKMTCDNATHSAHIEGTVVNGNAQDTFTADAVDNGEPGTTDRFSITLSPEGYSRSGTLKRGNIQYHQ